jgi:hypothetical protein
MGEREAGQGPGSDAAGPGSDSSGAGNGSRGNGESEPGNDGRNSEAGGKKAEQYAKAAAGQNTSEKERSGTELQRRITESLENRPFLDLINRIPGKDGQWIVIPFSFSEDGFDFTVSLRIFVNNDIGKSLVSGRLTADIKVTRLGREQKRWLIILGRTEENSELSAELSVFSGSDPWRFSAAEKKQAKRELAAALGIPPDRVSIREDASPFADSRKSALRSVNEEV